MTTATLPSPDQSYIGRIAAATWVKLGIVAIAALQFAQVFTRSINWDEFGHYNHIVQLHAGELGQVLQRFHAFAYSWVTALPGSPIDHIILIRLFMFACEMVALLAIVGVASRFADRVPALLCGLAYISFSYVFQHGASFRYDSPLAAALMGLLWLLLRARPGGLFIVGGGLVVALLPFISMKAVLYAPAFAGVAWLRWSERGFDREYPVRLFALAAAAVVWFAALYFAFVQWTSLLSANQDSLSAGQAAETVFALFGNPNGSRILRAALTNPLTSLLVLAFPIALARIQRAPAEKVALAGLFAVVLTPIIYVNTAPYYFVFMLAPVMAACGPAMELLLARLSAGIVALLLMAGTAIFAFTEEPSPLEKQRELHAATLATFGEDVNYFDFPGFLGTQGKANAFLSPLMVAVNNNEGQLMLRPAMEDRPVPLMIANNFILENALAPDAVQFLQQQDTAALRDNYVPFWGPLWIAGRNIPADQAIAYRNLVPGTFTAYGHAILVDGEAVEAGESVCLERGTYRLEAADGPARLLWGENIEPPAELPPEPPYWQHF